MPDIVVEDIAAAVQAGLIVLPNSSRLFVEIATLDYPKENHTCRLTVKAEQVNSEEVKANAMAIALQLLSDKTEVIRQNRKQWLDELEEMRSNDA